jgi:hypothetical protein
MYLLSIHLLHQILLVYKTNLIIDIVSLSFSLFLLQLYNEEIIDLFDPDRDQVAWHP